LGFGQAVCLATPICKLPENSEVPFAIRLECNPLPVQRPGGITIRSSYREPPRRCGSRQFIYPDCCFLAIIDSTSQTFAVRRDPRRRIWCLRKFQRLDTAFPIHKRESELNP